MKNNTKFVQFVQKLAQILKEAENLTESQDAGLLVAFFLKDIQTLLTALSEDIADIEKAQLEELIAVIAEEGIIVEGIIIYFDLWLLELSIYIINLFIFSSNTKDPNKLASSIQSIFFYLITWIADNRINAAYSEQKQHFDLIFDVNNLQENFWYKRSDLNGIHVFGENNMYLKNTIPSATRKYYSNSEIYNNPYSNQLPKNVIVNPFPVDTITDVIQLCNFINDLYVNIPFTANQNLVFSARIKVENLKNGSRGWGFWNTNVFPGGMQFAWFIQIDGHEDSIESDLNLNANIPMPNNGFYAQTMNGLVFSQIKLHDLDEEWHDYQIVLNKYWVEYFVDGKSVAKVIDPGCIPNMPLAFHNWVDNCYLDIKLPNISEFNKKNNFKNIGYKKILQRSDNPRSNCTQYMRIASMG